MMGLASPSHKWDTWRRNHWNIVHNSRRLRKRKKKRVGWRKVHARSPFERSASARYPRRFRRARRDDKVGRRLQSPNRRRPLKLNCLHKENCGKQDIIKQNRKWWINNSTLWRAAMCVEWGHGDRPRIEINPCLAYPKACWGLVRIHCDFSATAWPGSCCCSCCSLAAETRVEWRQGWVCGSKWPGRNDDGFSACYSNRLG